jgi:subtilisin family serine protease
MKTIIFYILSLTVVFANTTSSIPYIDGTIYDKIVIKLSADIYLANNEANNSNTLENIATSLDSNVENLFNLPIPPNSEDNNSLVSISIELNNYRTIAIDGNLTKDEILQAVERIKLLHNIDVVYLEPRAELAYVDSSLFPNSSNTTTPPVSQLGNFISYQGYLNPAPQGIDAKYAWTIQGGNGENVKIVDVEGAWNTAHNDLPDMFTSMGGNYNDSGWEKHGTAVAGVVTAVDNGFGTKGIVSDAEMGSANIFALGVSNAIINAANTVGPGGVIIIEVQQGGGPNTANCSCNQGQCNLVPVEYYLSNFDAIRYATIKGVTVVEAAGNGSVNFDHSAYNGKFNRQVRDSGAILVAASNGSNRTPACFTNYGNRIDVHGWGWNVATLSYGDLYNGGQNSKYTNTFSGTSSASPIVAGAAASLQSIAKSNIGRFLTPAEVRNILSSTATPQSGEFSKRIAGLPNLRSAIAHLPAPETIPNKPSNLILSDVSFDTVTLKWTDNTTTEQGYKIYKGSTLIATLSANTTSYKIENLEDDTSYTYTIKAFNSAGESSPLTVTFKTDKNLAWLIPAIYYPILLSN